MLHMKIRGGAISVQSPATSWRWNEIDQSPAIFPFENDGDFLETIVDFPAGPLLPYDFVPMEDHCLEFHLIPSQGQRLARQFR